MYVRVRARMRVLGWSVSDPSHAEVRGSNSARGMISTKSAVMSAMYCLAMRHFLSKTSYQMRKSNLVSGINHERSTSHTRTPLKNETVTHG